MTQKQRNLYDNTPILAGMFGGWEIVMIFAAMLVFAFSAVAVLGIVWLIVRETKKKSVANSPLPPPPRI